MADLTMNPFTAHPQRQGITYFEHGRFALGIACRLLASVAAFALHAALPFVPVARRFDLAATATYLNACNRRIETAKRAAHPGAEPDLAAFNQPRALRGLLATQQ